MLKSILFCFILFKSTFVYPKNKEIITIRADEWCPYNCNPNEGRLGFMVEAVKEIFKKKNIEIDYNVINWARAIKETERGKFDAIIGATKNDAPNFIFPNEMLGKSRNCFYTLTNSTWKFKGVKSLEKVQLGVVKDYSYFEDLDNYLKDEKNKGKIDESFGEDAIIRMINKLFLNRMDTFVENELVVQYILHSEEKKFDPTKVRSAGCAEVQWPVYVAFSPAHPQSKLRAKIFDDGLKELKKNGTLVKIISKYSIKKWW